MCFFDFPSQWSCSWGFQRHLFFGRWVSQAEASHPGPAPLTTEGASTAPESLNQVPLSFADPPAASPGAQVPGPAMAQAFSSLCRGSQVPPCSPAARPCRFCSPTLPHNHSRHLSVSPAPGRRRSCSPVHARGVVKKRKRRKTRKKKSKKVGEKKIKKTKKQKQKQGKKREKEGTTNGRERVKKKGEQEWENERGG